jgi:hypothetical protein
MGYALIGIGSNAAGPATPGDFKPILGGGVAFPVTVETQTQLPMPVAGTLSGLSGLVTTAPVTGQLRRNGADAAQSFTDTAPTSPASDVCASGDLMALAWGAGGGAVQHVQMILVTRPQHATVFAASPPSAATFAIPGNNRYSLSLAGAMNGFANAVNPATSLQIGVPGTLQGLAANITANAITSAQPYPLYLNGAADPQAPVIGPGLTGVFQDTAHQTAVNVGDLISTLMYAAGGALSVACHAIGFVNSTGPASDLFCSIGPGISPSATCYYPIYGGLWGLGLNSDAAAGIAHGFAVTTSGLRINVTVNATTAAASLTSRKNGAPGNQSATIGAGLTGWFADSANQDQFGPTDKANHRLVNGPGPGNPMTAYQIAVTETAPYIMTASVAETGAAADTVTSRYAPSRDVVTEGAVANDTVIGFLGAGQYTLEEASAIDTPRGIRSTRPMVFELGRALDTPSGGVRRENDIAESGAAQDFIDGFTRIPKTVIEQGAARDAEIVMGSLAYTELLGMTARTVHRHPVTGGILDDEAIPLLDDQGVSVFEDS